VGKFEENASDGPDVNTCAVDLGAEKHLWSSVPKCDNFMGETFKWKTEWPGEAKICNFNLFFLLVDEQVAGFQVSVHDSSLVAVEKTLEDLPDDGLEMRHGQSFPLFIQIFFHI